MDLCPVHISIVLFFAERASRAVNAARGTKRLVVPYLVSVNSSCGQDRKDKTWLVRTNVVVVVARMIKSVVTGQAPVTLEWRNTPGKKTQTKPQVVHAYIIADAIHASSRKI